MKWVSELPVMEKIQEGYMEKRGLLVWIDDPKTKTKAFVQGRCVNGEFYADGWNGTWIITHWMEVEPPKETV